MKQAGFEHSIPITPSGDADKAPREIIIKMQMPPPEETAYGEVSVADKRRAAYLGGQTAVLHAAAECGGAECGGAECGGAEARGSETGRGRYKSKYLREVTSLLQGAGQPLSAGEVYLRLSDIGSRIGKTTVYRTLCRLAEEGTLLPIRGRDDHDTRYLYCEGPHDHYHLICTECGSVRHLSCDMLGTLYRHIREEHGFSVNRERTSLYGICAACRRARLKH